MQAKIRVRLPLSLLITAEYWKPTCMADNLDRNRKYISHIKIDTSQHGLHMSGKSSTGMFTDLVSKAAGLITCIGSEKLG